MSNYRVLVGDVQETLSQLGERSAAVALEHGRDAILCELNPDYVELIPDRINSITDALVQGRLFEGVG